MPEGRQPAHRELGRRPPSVGGIGRRFPLFGGGMLVGLLLTAASGVLVRVWGAEFGDLYQGIAAMWLLAACVFFVALRAGREMSRREATVFAAPALALIGLHSFVLLDNPRLAALLPVSNLVVVGNWLPLGVGWLAGLAWRHVPRPVWRKLLAVVPLTAVCAWHSYGWMRGEPPRCGDFWRSGVCIQTSRATCSAACAATLLKAHGIEASEAEMARLCLSRSWGTTRLGLYRGLKLKTAGSYEVKPLSWTLDELRERSRRPVLLHVRLEPGAEVDPRYARDWGWTPGQAHAVVLFRFLPDDLVEMGDPSVGREKWHVDSLRVLWRGDGMRLVPR